MKYSQLTQLLAVLILAALALPSSSLPALAQATPAPGLTQNFDEQIPGDAPSGWIKLWGNQGDDQFTITNIKAVSGKNSLLLDRQSGTNVAQWGFGRPLPTIDDGWYVTQFDFNVDGAGSDIDAGFELRAKGGGNERACVLGLSGLSVGLSSGDWKQKVVLGQIVPGTWYRVTLWTPTTNGKQTAAYATLESQDSGQWKPVGTAQNVPATVPVGDYGFLEVNTVTSKRNFRVYIDDLSVQQRNGDHP
jgi:hypothetical protein